MPAGEDTLQFAQHVEKADKVSMHQHTGYLRQ